MTINLNVIGDGVELKTAPHKTIASHRYISLDMTLWKEMDSVDHYIFSHFK